LQAAGEAAPVLDIARFAAGPAAEALQAALADAKTPQLHPRYATDVRRLRCDLLLPGAKVEAAFDEGAITAGERSAPLHELELELKSGDVRALCALAASWAAHGSLWLDTRAKSARGVVLARGEQHGPALKAKRPQVDDTMSGPAFVRAVVRNTL